MRLPSLQTQIIGALCIVSFSAWSGFAFTSQLPPLSLTTCGWKRTRTRDQNPFRMEHRNLYSKKSDDYDEEEEEEIDLSDKDWRAFRAQLVMSKGTENKDAETSSSATDTTQEDDEPLIFEDDLDGIGALFSSPSTSTYSDAMSETNFTPLNPSQWAYDSGKVIEEGAVILGGVEQDYGFGLRQQYFHKAVILVLDHDEATFTKGIILNRPSDRVLKDDNGYKWRIWFGGDVQGLDTIVPDIICLHSIEGVPEVDEASIVVMKDIKRTTFDEAQKLVEEKKAKPSDFWVFAGYAGWGPGQLMGELDRKSWYMCATDSQTLLKELAKQSAYTDPRDAGLDTWELLMNMIGRGDTADDCSGDFEDLMLKEWARDKVLSAEAGGNAGLRTQPSKVASTQQVMRVDSASIDDVMKRAQSEARGEKVTVGSMVRASSVDRSPFLLENQEYHKSVVLVLLDDVNLSVGAILNLPAANGVELALVDKNTGAQRMLQIPVRFGGQYAIQGQSPTMWLHYSESLRKAEVGSPIGETREASNGIWKCTQDEASSAIGQGLARPSDFLIVSGLCVWTKGAQSATRGIQGEVMEKRFQVIPQSQFSEVWAGLKKQEVLTKVNLLKNLSSGYTAWKAASADDKSEDSDEDVISDGIGEGYDEENDSYVFKSDKTVSQLSDDALRSWVATFLLGAPTLGA